MKISDKVFKTDGQRKYENESKEKKKLSQDELRFSSSIVV